MGPQRLRAERRDRRQAVELHYRGPGFSPAVANGVVYIGSGDYLYALDATTGAKLWRSNTGGDSSPAVANGVVYVGIDNNVYALNAATGAKLWSFTTGSDVRSSPAVVNGMLYVGAGYEHGIYTPSICRSNEKALT